MKGTYRFNLKVLEMEICLAVLDADGAILDHEDITALILPFKCISRNSIIDVKGERINLKNDVRNC